MQTTDQLLQAQIIYKRALKLMGNHFEFGVMGDAEDEGWANNCIDAAIYEVRRIEVLLSVFSGTSQIYIINKNAGIKPVEVDKEIFDIIKKSIHSYGASITDFPIASKKLVQQHSFRNIILDESNHSVYLSHKGMRIRLSDIGKEYAAERAKYILKENGVENGIVNAAHDLLTWGFLSTENTSYIIIDDLHHNYTTKKSNAA